jgi:hypothetical protein
MNKTKFAKTATLLFASAMMSLVLPSIASAADYGISFTENLDGTLTVDNANPSAGAIVVGGMTDDWTLDFSAMGMSFGGGGIGMTWLEAPGEPGVNYLQQDSSTVLELVSEDTDPSVQPPAYTPDCGGTPGPLPDGTTCLIGNDSVGNSYYATVVETVAATPEPASLFMSGLGLAGLAIAGIRRKRKA